MTETDMATRISHLTLVVGGLAAGKDLLETPSSEGGVILADDEGDLLEIITEITEDVVPNYYKNDWVRFIMDYTQVLANAGQDIAEAKAAGESLPETYLIDAIRLFINAIYQDGKLMVA